VTGRTPRLLLEVRRLSEPPNVLQQAMQARNCTRCVRPQGNQLKRNTDEGECNKRSVLRGVLLDQLQG